MKSDPTLDAIREVRHQISAAVDHDASKLVEHYRKLQERHSARVISGKADKSKSHDKYAA